MDRHRDWFSGAMLLASGGEFSAHPLGAIALLGAIVAWNLGSVLSQRKLSLAPGAMGFASEMLLGGVFLVGAGQLQHRQRHRP